MIPHNSGQIPIPSTRVGGLYPDDVQEQATQIASIEGIDNLWLETLGIPDVCIAILDGPVDTAHECFQGADLSQIETHTASATDRGPAAAHGTHVASVIFGQHNGPVQGIAPQCRGVAVPIFQDAANGAIAPCSQVDLAHAIGLALQHGADVINVSGGQLSPTGTAHPLLTDAVRNCARRGVLVVAAAGNDGCDCLHVPGALDAVLAVGAMDPQGQPLQYSNWGETYSRQGILAPGVAILGAIPRGSTTVNNGTSYATAIVSGVVALLLCFGRKRGINVDAHSVRAAILASAIGCDQVPATDCQRMLAGRLNVEGAMSRIQLGESTMNEAIESQTAQQAPTSDAACLGDAADACTAPRVTASAADMNDKDAETGVASRATLPAAGAANRTHRHAAAILDSGVSGIKASACGCGSGGPAQLIGALGQLGYDFGNEARRDSFIQAMSNGASPHNPREFLDYLNDNPASAASVIWTLNIDATPVYAIQPTGPFAREVYERLREFLDEQLSAGVERVSVPGWTVGSAQLLNGQVVPLLHPELRGMFNWNTSALVDAVCPGNTEADNTKRQAVANFLDRIYHETRNLGVAPQDRALNFAATNALNVANIFESALKDDMDLDSIEAERSPICRPDADCWDVLLTFFNPHKLLEQARKVYRFTVDVSDVIPVTVGGIRSWFVR